MIEVKNLCKSYGDKLAVDNISFEAHNGEILGFLGPNGAGKSTTMNILTGYLSSTSGEAYINGKEILEEPLLAKKEIGYLPEFPPLYLDMTVKEYLYFMYELKGVKIPRNTHLQEICELVKIEEVYNRLIKNLSKGYKQRVGLAQALVGNPNVLILDEPTVGLDPKQIIEIRTLIKKLGKNHTVILSSHILSEVQAVCDRIVIINGGKIIADDTADNLSNTLTADHKLVARIDGPREEVTKVISTIPGVVSVLADMQREKGVWEYNIEAVEGTDIRRELNRRLAQRSWYIMGLRPSELTLEDIFLRLTMGESVDEFINQKAESIEKQGEAKKA
ncbi:MAG: ABC transporter ATP-binding protein [Oscillospiraceae bacterium]|nr:ABC transporter ATP-binding protein [Oscillospiraceae bacterium]